MGVSIGGSGGGAGNTTTSTSTIEGSFSNTQDAASQGPGSIGNNSSATSLVIGAGATVQPGGIVFQDSSPAALAAMGTLAGTALTDANEQITGAEGGILSYAQKAQAGAQELASQATPVNTKQILLALGFVFIAGLVAWELTHGQNS